MLATGRGRTDAEGNSSGSNGARQNKAGASPKGARFQVLGKLGEGAQWAAYRVQRRADGAVLALKALKPAANRHPRLSQSLAAVAQKWETLRHPGLVSLHECGDEQGTFFISTDFMAGGSLEKALANGPLPPGEALEILRQLCAPLIYLHGQNIAHGDVRPRQILFDELHRARLSDGGLAQGLAGAGLPLADFHPDAAYYLAPERSSGATIAPAADVYSLGATFYRMLTGRVPFEGSAPLAVIARHRGEMPAPPSQINPRLSSAFDGLALEMLDKNPQNRPSLSELLLALEARSAQSASASTTPPAIATLGANEAAPIQQSANVPLSDEEKPQVTLPKRRPIDALLEETIQKEAAQSQKNNLKMARKKHRRREFWGFLGSVVFLLLLIGAGVGGAWGAYAYWINATPKEVRVPKYIGQSQQDAKNSLAKAGLTMKVAREKYDPKVKAGTVLSGDPEENRHVRAHREVLVTISAGEAPIKMLDFSNLTLPQARTIIGQHGMRLGPIADQYHDTIPRGAICGQFPEAGEPFRRSDPITLIISRGQQPKEIDATTGEVTDQTSLYGANNGDSSADSSGDFAPLPNLGANAVTPAADGQSLETQSAIAKVTLPAGGGTQLVKIVVSDAKGERIVYQKAAAAGQEVSQKVTVTRASDQLALVRIYVGDVLVKEDRL